MTPADKTTPAGPENNDGESSRRGVAAQLAHEINQPLAAIVNYLSVGALLLDGVDGDKAAKAKEMVQRASEQAMRAGEVIRRLREAERSGEEPPADRL